MLYGRLRRLGFGRSGVFGAHHARTGGVHGLHELQDASVGVKALGDVGVIEVAVKD